MRRELFEEAYRKFWDFIEAQEMPRYQCNSYDVCDLAWSAEWRIHLTRMFHKPSDPAEL